MIDMINNLHVVWWMISVVLLLRGEGVDHSRQGAGQPQSELWHSVPSTRSPTHGAQRAVVGLRHWGKAPKKLNCLWHSSKLYLSGVRYNYTDYSL